MMNWKQIFSKEGKFVLIKARPFVKWVCGKLEFLYCNYGFKIQEIISR